VGIQYFYVASGSRERGQGGCGPEMGQVGSTYDAAQSFEADADSSLERLPELSAITLSIR
jgi:hypothetical protein